MTIRQLYFCAFTFTFALVGSILLLAVVMDIVSLPNPGLVTVHYVHTMHVHRDVADAEAR